MRNKMNSIELDRGVIKTILNQGTTEETCPNGVIAKIHYIARRTNGEEFDNTYVRNKPEEFTVGEGQVIPGIDIAVRSMTKQETSKFIFTSRHTHTELSKKSKSEFNTTDSLEYEIQLLDWRSVEPPENEWILSFEEKLKIGNNLKEDGNLYFKEEKFMKAFRLYKRALKTLKRTKSSGSTLDETSQQQTKQLNSLKITCLSNMAACNIKLQRYNEADSNCSEILSDLAGDLSVDQKLKVLYRRGQANLALSEFDKAREYLEAAKQLAPENKPVLIELKKLQQQETQYKNQLKNMYQKMFD